MIKKIFKASISAALYLSAVIIALNVIYLSGLVDFYKPELTTFNSEDDLSEDNGKDTILVMGDSFSAGNGSYPNILRNIVPRYRIINSSVSGTGIIETKIMAKKRITRFKPRIFIYQIYVGNDMINITYPINWGKISLARNVYWALSSRIRVVSFINYRLGQLEVSIDRRYTEFKPSPEYYISNDEFSVEKYTERPVIYNTADSNLINNTVLLEGRRKEDFGILIAGLKKVLKLLPIECRTIIVVVPHMAQLNELNLSRAKQLGARLDEPDRILETDYPFIEQLEEQLPGAVILNALIPLRQAEEKEISVYYTNDDHLNINGQKILADYIALEIEALNRQ